VAEGGGQGTNHASITQPGRGALEDLKLRQIKVCGLLKRQKQLLDMLKSHSRYKLETILVKWHHCSDLRINLFRVAWTSNI